MLVDDGSRNGSYCNGERIVGQRPLRDGDVLRFGDTVVLFRAPGADPERTSQAAEPEQVTSFGETPTVPQERFEVDPE
jgi:pSer/pThr/pTyr-binding forkhead associated (FHA) protein